jgi:hypothetical protein
MKDLIALAFLAGIGWYINACIKGLNELTDGLAAWIVNQKRDAQRGAEDGDVR